MITRLEFMGLARKLREVFETREETGWREGFLAAVGVVVGVLGLNERKFADMPFVTFSGLVDTGMHARITNAYQSLDALGTEMHGVVGQTRAGSCYRLVHIPGDILQWQENHYRQAFEVYTVPEWQKKVAEPAFAKHFTLGAELSGVAKARRARVNNLPKKQ
jgi:hypothetical protein